MRVPFRKFIDEHPNEILVLDGGQGTELENRGVNINSPLWSTISFVNDKFWDENIENTERKCIREMFNDFKDAGANVFSTLTYQTSFSSVSENTDIKSLQEYHELLRKITGFCRRCISDDDYLLGCIGAYAASIGAEYDGNYGLFAGKIDYLKYFKPQLDEFNNDMNIDIIGFETIPNKHELEAILSWDEDIINRPFFIALSLSDKNGLRDGTSFEEMGRLFAKYKGRNKNLVYVGGNCISYAYSIDNIRKLHDIVPHLNLIAYPNSGEIYDQKSKQWSSTSAIKISWEEVVNEYADAGVKIIGGCCRTTPDDIKQIKKAVDAL
ncbi:hypothetical protein TPHA_0I00260 [Tetrapisispora phaffii CBS 4417]|uniref:Hcy-binding domain-containing protein n=1 Tax=Tetrapisispora phaffii (strain ATCC 24235 / CBS 4417 / NBRC 1672 / NRRL Y-8282 / UCD 70-5) TaxID=1071381 RepID=G8BXA5_TETPH|nr:hypothetical protein TPHA_0I00260 [Tetrapisispora phaffii CBS 4417]CCE64533.1 hypothetical protein TPHA_0I00260 [Tetrapisispora phaffii CBS 4417]